MRRAQLRGNILDMRPKVNALARRFGKGVPPAKLPRSTGGLDRTHIIARRAVARLRPLAAVAITPAPSERLADLQPLSDGFRRGFASLRVTPAPPELTGRTDGPRKAP